MRKPKNQVSREEARRLDERSKMSPRQWEQRVAHLLRLNGWDFHHERDRAGGAKANSRKPGFPDYIVHKTFRSGVLPPAELLRLMNPPWSSPLMQDQHISIVGFIEAKTGKGIATLKQAEWLDAAWCCPGMFAYVARPERETELVALLGGEWGS